MLHGRTLVTNMRILAALLLIGTLAPFAATAAVAFDASSITTSHTSTGSDRVIYTTFFTTGGDTVTAVSIGGVGYTKVCSIQRPGTPTGRWQAVWRAIAPPTGAQTITVTGAYALIASASYTGADQTTQPDNSWNSGTATGTTPLAVSNTSANDTALLVGGFGNHNFVISASTDTQIRANAASGVGMYDATAATSPAGSKTLTISATSPDNIMGCVAHIRAAVAAAATEVPADQFIMLE